ncbi:unnamed protein product [Mytilus coruscus]|uniref:Uncharacterized protein n=1 Tax=Mytilus coruscus TaxID=42192 RepID=A0A6J8BFY5_MYTCO|nr:unnamed protein product [Mytilus coruscus]
MLVILELYKHYRELVYYQNMLPLEANDAFVNSTSFDGFSTNEHVNDVTLKTSTDATIKSRKHSENIQLDKTLKELGSIIKEVRNILLLILLSPRQIGINQLNMILDALYKPKENKSKPPELKNTAPKSTIAPLVSTQMPLSSTTTQFETTKTANTKSTSQNPINEDKRKKLKKNKKQKRKRKKYPKFIREAMNDFRDIMIEYNEVWAEYQMMQRFMPIFGR